LKGKVMMMLNAILRYFEDVLYVENDVEDTEQYEHVLIGVVAK